MAAVRIFRCFPLAAQEENPDTQLSTAIGNGDFAN